MTTNKQPTYGNGKICYIEIPATDINRSAAFYKAVFGWNIREHIDGNVSFDDAVNEVSGIWVTGRRPSNEEGFIIHIMVDDAESTINSIIANGGKLTQAIGADAPEITAKFTDPGGNIMGIYQQPL